MSEFFKSDTQAMAADDLERELRREERLHAERRRMATWGVALAVAGTVILGGGIAAFAASQRPAMPAAANVIAAPIKAAKAKSKHKKKHKKVSSLSVVATPAA